MPTIVIAGLGSAGFAALSAIKRQQPKTSIIIIDPKEHDIVHPCGYPYSLEGIIDEVNLSQDIELSKMNVERIKSSLVSIDAVKKICTIGSGIDRVLQYDSLLLSLGFRPFIPAIDGIADVLDKKLFTLNSLQNLSRIRSLLNNGTSGIVIGGGAIGLESAVAMKKYLKNVLLLEMREHLLPGILDKDMAGIVEEYLREEGIELRLKASVQRTGGGETLLLVTSDGQSFEADMGIMASGFIANSDAARNSGIHCDDNGIVVNRFLETSAPGILAAGDCISGWSVIDGKPIRSRLATSAYRQGIVAARNAMGDGIEYRGSAGTFVTKIGSLEIAGTGFTIESAKKRGFEPVQGRIRAGIFPDYYPDRSHITIKVICDNGSGRILGAQAVGKKGAAERINIVSTAIEFGLTVDELDRIELAYCPAVSEVYDPLLRALDFADRRRKR